MWEEDDDGQGAPAAPADPEARARVEAAYAAHRKCITADWRLGDGEIYLVKHRRQAVADLLAMVDACVPLLAATRRRPDDLDLVRQRLAQVEHDLKFAGARSEALVEAERVLQWCHEIVAEAAQAAGALREMRERFEVTGGDEWLLRKDAEARVRAELEAGGETFRPPEARPLELRSPGRGMGPDPEAAARVAGARRMLVGYRSDIERADTADDVPAEQETAD